MSLSEFELIERYFKSQLISRSDVILGIGDDAALVNVPQGYELVITTDSLVSGVHFLEAWPAYDIAYKALAVNLSDLAAMGAEPAWAMLSMTLPNADESWLAEFSRGFFSLAESHQIQLIGGNVSRGPLVLTLQLHGFVPKGKALLRSGAKEGDLIYVTGHLGTAAVALMMEQGNIPRDPDVLKLLRQPQARIHEGIALRGIASSAIDISDGLAADLNHILEESKVGAVIDEQAIPLSPELSQYLPYQEAWQKALFNGDDYELCFTVPPNLRTKLEEVMKNFSCGVHLIGKIESQQGLRCRTKDKKVICLNSKGYQHF